MAPVERRLGPTRMLRLAVLGGGFPLALMAVTDDVVAVGGAWLIGGLMIVGWNVITVSLRQRIVPDHLLGRVNAGYRLLAWGTMPAGAALGGMVAEAGGPRAVFALASLAHAALLFVEIRLRPDHRDGDLPAATGAVAGVDPRGGDA